MTLNLGVIGVGLIGQDHIRRITTVVSGARVAAVTDVDLSRAGSVAGGLSDVRVHRTGQDLIADEGIDAVVVTSWGGTHEEYVLAGIQAGKHVFCEKPLATTREACERIVDAEVAAGRRLVMVGFMRRFDRGYQAMKQTVARGDIGVPLLFHSAHRNPAVPPGVDTDGVIVDTCVHDIDIARWLLADEVAAVRVLAPRRNSRAGAMRDPLLMLLEMAGGAVVDVEISVNIAYGYDIRGEVVGESGTASLAEGSPVTLRRDGHVAGPVPADWRERFTRAYDIELAAWIEAAARGTATGPNAWDGTAAAAVCDAALAALRSGERAEVALGERPGFYK